MLSIYKCSTHGRAIQYTLESYAIYTGDLYSLYRRAIHCMLEIFTVCTGKLYTIAILERYTLYTEEI